MLPTLFGFPTYGLCFFFGSIITIVTGIFLARRHGVDKEIVIDSAVIGLGLGMFGSRLLYVIENWSWFAEQPISAVFRLDQGGVSFYGAVLFNVPGLLIYYRVKKLPTFKMMDLFAFSVPLSQFFGRLGCFSTGCCWGSRCEEGSTSAAFAVTFPTETPVWVSHVVEHLGMEKASVEEIQAALPTLPAALQEGSWPVLPTQLYLAGAGVLITILTIAMMRRPHREGQVFAVTIAALVAARFLIELVRADSPAILLGLSEAQWISALLFAAAVALYIWRGRVGRPMPAPLPDAVDPNPAPAPTSPPSTS